MGTAIGRRDRDLLKAEVLRDLLAGADHDRLERLGHDYGLELADRHLRTDVVERLRWHQREGHTVVLVSASLRYYLAPLAERLRADEVLCTEVEVGADGRLTGRLVGASCRAAEKVARLHARYGPDVALAWAYGDSPGDRELLAAARTGVMIGRRRLTAAPATSVAA